VEAYLQQVLCFQVRALQIDVDFILLTKVYLIKEVIIIIIIIIDIIPYQ